MLFLAERPATLGRSERSRGTEALIKEARQRRRRRWLRGAGAVLLVTAGATTWTLLEHPAGAPRAANVTASQPVTAGGCAAAAYGPLPTWARSGFSPPSIAMPHVLSARGDIVAVLWAQHNPLVTPPSAERANKILWVSKLPPSAGPATLEITAQRLVGGTAVGPVQRRTVAGGPGPSLIDMPTAGCWQFTLRWSGHTDTVDLAYAAGSVPARPGS